MMIRFFLYAFVTVLCSACFLFTSIPYPSPQGDQVQLTRRAEVIEGLIERAQIPEEMQRVLLARVRVKEGRERSRFRMLVTVQSDRVLKVELLPDQVAVPFAVLMQTGDAVYAISNADKVFLTAENSEELLDELWGIPLEPLELVSLLFRSVPVTQLSDFKGQVFETNSSIQFVHDDKRRFWSFSKPDVLLEHVEFRDSASTRNVVYADIEGARVKLWSPRQDLEMDFIVTASKLAPKVALELVAPKTFRKVRL